jgi:hypothetical protein
MAYILGITDTAYDVQTSTLCGHFKQFVQSRNNCLANVAKLRLSIWSAEEKLARSCEQLHTREVGSSRKSTAMNEVRREKRTVAQLVKKFPAM